MRRRFLTILILLSFTRICLAEEAFQEDRITVSGGVILTGQIQAVSDSSILLKTDYAGILTVDLKKVERVHLEPARETGLPEALLKAGDAGKDAAPPAKPAVAKKKKAPEKEAKQAPKWDLSGRFSLVGWGGNTEKVQGTASMKAELEREFDRINLYGAYTYLDDPRKKKEIWQPETSNEVKLGGRYTNFFHKKTGVFFREEMERDRFEGINFRSTSASGLSFQFKNTKELRLESRAGFSFRYEYKITGEEEEYPGMDFGFDIFWQFASWGSFTGEYTYTPSVERLTSYIFSQDSYVDLPIQSAKWLSLQIGLFSQYNSDIVRNREHLDYRYYASMTAKWK